MERDTAAKTLALAFFIVPLQVTSAAPTASIRKTIKYESEQPILTTCLSNMVGCVRMDLNAARMFVATVQAGSLSAAATRLGIPLPTLSRRIRELERQLKVQLLERSARGTKLTDAGTRLYGHASLG